MTKKFSKYYTFDLKTEFAIFTKMCTFINVNPMFTVVIYIS